MPDVPALEIEETSGARRIVVLTGRALPYRGAAWGGSQRHKLSWYAGNPKGTLQVLGPQESPTNLQGTWKSRFLGSESGAVFVAGFDEVTNAQGLVEVFDELRRAGNALRVQWGRQVREGILSEFEPSYITIEDVRWTCAFTWFGREGVEAPRASAAEQPESELRRDQNAVDDQAAFEPATVTEEYSEARRTGLSAVRSATTQLFDRSREIRSQAQDLVPAVTGFQAAAETLRTAIGSEVQALVERPYTEAQGDDGVLAVLELDTWRRGLGRRLDALRARGLSEALSFRGQAVPPPLARLGVPAGISLRTLALRYYGSADDWTLIADANGLSASVLTAPTVLEIPAPRGAPV